ncbi:uncharacterized protein V6R79_015981 [Siganus canaliculatus]
MQPSRQLHTPTNLLLLSLAVSDFLFSLVVTPLELIRQGVCWLLTDLMCALCNLLTVFIVFMSVGNVVLISVDRYLAIVYPLQYSSRVTVKKVQICICSCWLLSLVYNSLIIHEDLSEPSRTRSCDGECVFVFGHTTAVVDMLVTFVLPITVIVVLYLRVFVVAVSQARAMRSHVVLQAVKPKKSELKAARTLGVVVCVFLVCFCPYVVVSVLEGSSVMALNVSLAIYAVNPCLNPVIYALFYRWFRKAIRLIVSLQILQLNSREISLL